MPFLVTVPFFYAQNNEINSWKKKHMVVVQKIMQYAITDFFLKATCLFFTPIDSSHYSVYKSMKVQ